MPKLEIRPIGLFHQPKSIEELENQIYSGAKEEQACKAMGMGFTWNYLAGVIEDFFKTGDRCPCCGRPKEKEDE